MGARGAALDEELGSGQDLASRVTQIRVGTQGLLQTGYEAGLDNSLNLSKTWNLFSLHVLICKIEVIPSLPADLLPKLENICKVSNSAAHSKCSITGNSFSTKG